MYNNSLHIGAILQAYSYPFTHSLPWWLPTPLPALLCMSLVLPHPHFLYWPLKRTYLTIHFDQLPSLTRRSYTKVVQRLEPSRCAIAALPLSHRCPLRIRIYWTRMHQILLNLDRNALPIQTAEQFLNHLVKLADLAVVDILSRTP